MLLSATHLLLDITFLNVHQRPHSPQYLVNRGTLHNYCDALEVPRISTADTNRLKLAVRKAAINSIALTANRRIIHGFMKSLCNQSLSSSSCELNPP